MTGSGSTQTATEAEAEPGGSGRPAAPSRVAVLGGTGFVGGAVARHLLTRGYDVLVIARTERNVPAGARFTSLDLSAVAAEALAAALGEFEADAVVNAAGGMWGLTEEEMVAANVTLVDRLIQAVSHVPNSRPRLVHLGSVHEYGLVPIGDDITETMVPAPVMPYGKLKLECAEAVLEATRRGTVDGVVLRVGNVVGAGQPGHSLLGVVASRLHAARTEGGTIELQTGPLGSQRDFLALADAVDAVEAAIVSAEATGQVVNIGSGEAHSARQLVGMLMEACGVPATLIETSAGEAETDWQRMAIGKAGEVLGWEPRRSLDEAVAELWAAVIGAASSE